MPDVSCLVTSTIPNTKIGEVVVNYWLVTTTVLNTNIREVGEKIPDVVGLVKKTDYNAKFETLRENTLLLLIIINF